MFERSSSGQQNRALFYGVEYTCYVEGGGGDDDRSPDSSFWHQVIAAFRPEIRVKFLPRGGKPILETLANDIISRDLSNTLVAMDADYDRVTGEIIGDGRILYSYGYSWENDVYERDCLPEIMKAITHRVSIDAVTVNKLGISYDKFAYDARRAVIVDMLALSAKSSILPRDAPGRVIRAVPGTGMPQIDRCELLKLTSQANRRTRPRDPVKPTTVPSGTRYLVGHCLAYGVALLLRSVMRDVGFKKSLAVDHLRDVAILVFSRHLSKMPTTALAIYHQSQCVGIP